MRSILAKIGLFIAATVASFTLHTTPLPTQSPPLETQKLGSTVFLPYQGGTGIGSAAGGDVGKCLQVSAAAPFTFSFGACGGGGGGSMIGLREGYGGAFTNKSSISFDAGAFNLNLANPDARLSLDYANGPASRSIAQTIAGAWTFTAASNQFSNTLEVGTASVSTLNIAGTPFLPSNYLPLSGGTLTGNLFGTNASLSGNLEVSGTASASKTFGSGLSSCTGKLLWSGGLFSCGTDQSGISSIAVREGTGTFVHVTSISFDAGAFNVTNTASESLVKLDYVNGPASRTLSNLFTAASNQFSNTLEVGTASVSALDIAGTPFLPSNYLPLSGGTLTGNLFGTNASFSATVEATTGKFTTLTSDTSHIGITGAASVSQNLEVAGAASASQTFGSGLTACDTGYFPKWATGTWSCQSIPLAGQLSYYLASSSSDVATYLVQRAQPQNTKTTLLVSGVNSTSVLANFITPVGKPGLSFIPAGTYTFHVHVSSTNPNSGQVYAEIWEANAAGADIAKIGTTETTAIFGGLSTSETEYELKFTDANVYTLQSSASRIVTRVWFLRNSSSHDVSLYMGGEADAHTSLPSNTVDATNFVPYTGATGDVNLGAYNLFTTNASVSSNLEVAGKASASSFFGAGLNVMTGTTGCTGATTDKLLYNATTGIFSCGVDQGGSGMSSQAGIAAGQVQFFQSSTVSSGSAKFVWDSTNKRLGINAGAAVDTMFEVGGTASISGLLNLYASPLSLQVGNSASISANLEVVGYASASKTFGSGLTTCSNALTYSATTGLFGCSGAYQSASTNLTNIAALGGNGFVGQTGANTYANRTLTGTTNQIDITNGDSTVGNPVWSIHTPFIIPGRASVSGNFEVVGGTASVSGITYLNGGLVIPNGSGGPTTAANGGLSVDTASVSLNFYSTSERIIDPRKCLGVVLTGSNLTAKSQFNIFMADDPYTISLVQVTTSGSNALGWTLLTGSATVPATNVFSANHSASGTGITKYTSFANAAVADGQKLDFVVSSTSAALKSVTVRTCLTKDP